jgi:dTDP-4-amino-4,6-dideoxygalactose transaminase
MNAALASAQLRELDAMLGRRKELARVLLEQARRAGRQVLLPDGEGLLPFSLALRVDRGAGEAISYAARQEVSAALAFENSVVARGLVPEDEVPTAARLAMSCVRFPLYPAMTNEELSQVGRVVATLP